MDNTDLIKGYIEGVEITVEGMTLVRETMYECLRELQKRAIYVCSARDSAAIELLERYNKSVKEILKIFDGVYSRYHNELLLLIRENIL